MYSIMIKDQKLLNLLIENNIILSNGKINTCYRRMLYKIPEYSGIDLTTKRKILFSIYDYNSFRINCKICNADLNQEKFHGTNFKFPDYDTCFDATCSKECENLLRGKSIKQFKKDNPEAEKIRVEKFKSTVSKLEENGNTKASNMAKKAANTKKSTFINGKSVFELQLVKSINTRISNGLGIDYNETENYKRYCKLVSIVTSRQDLSLLPDNHLRGLKSNDGYHLDHIFSKFDGFKFKISPLIIGDIVNLRFIPATANTTKGRKSEIMLEDLIFKYMKLKSTKL